MSLATELQLESAWKLQKCHGIGLFCDVQLLELSNREENKSRSHFQGETEGELLQASGENRLIHGARGLL